MKNVISMKDYGRDLREVSAMEFNVYCDESCHLEYDKQPVMALGAVWCLKDSVPRISDGIRELKAKHGISRGLEAKWTKVSPAKLEFYLDLISYFFANDSLNARVLVVPDKSILDHDSYNQDHNTWYYKMYYDMLKGLFFDRESRYNIYVDAKDTQGGNRIRTLHEILCRSEYDFDHRVIKKIQEIRSHEVEIMQIVDLLVGAFVYANRPIELQQSAAKRSVVEMIESLSRRSLSRSTSRNERKLNVLVWKPGKGDRTWQ